MALAPSRKGWIRIGILSTAIACLCVAALGAVIIAKATSLPPLALDEARKTSVIVTDKEGRLLRPFATDEGRWRLPLDLTEIDQDYLKLLLTYEDKRFYDHPGIDVYGLMRAAWQLATERRIVSGGSTITMQLARLMDGLEARSFSAKLTQLIRAGEIEKSLSKREILTLYLTLAPFGGNLEGLRAASLSYFGKEPKRLSWAERALLVALPQSPETRRPDRHWKTARAARNRVLDRAVEAKLISAAEARYAKDRPIPKMRRAFPLHAAHLAETEVAKYPGKQVHTLTIDRPLQTKLEKLAADHARRSGPKLSTAILVVEHQTGDIRAYVGSPGYLDHSRFGAIDMVDAVRSPGSALKPFIYGLAFDAGLAHPETLIEDRPARFGEYAPKNFDDEFRGTMTIREALQTSRNVTAVKVLAAVGPARLAHRFEQGDPELDVPPNLAIALGGVGMRLKSLAHLYAALARGGDFVDLATRRDIEAPAPTKAKPERIMSPVAAWYVANILAGAPPPKNAQPGKIAFKTGTSYGYRDAWAVGFDGKYVVAVWIGRPDGTPTPGLVGLRSAAPLLFDAFARISPARTKLPPAPKGALVAKTADLPKRLVHFKEPGFEDDAPPTSGADPVKIAFPPNKSELELGPNGGGLTPVALKAEGGKLPLTWLADGIPLSGQRRRRGTFWRPTGPGFHKFTVIDAEGNVDRVSVRIR